MSVSRLFFSLGASALLLVAVRLSAQQPAPATATPTGNVEHGRYIVERVIMCYECHSTRDPQGIIVAGTRFKGGAEPMRPSRCLHVPRPQILREISWRVRVSRAGRCPCVHNGVPTGPCRSLASPDCLAIPTRKQCVC